MTNKSILKQIDTIREATARASVSREAAARFLSNAGITVSRSAQSGALSHSSQSGRWVTKHKSSVPGSKKIK